MGATSSVPTELEGKLSQDEISRLSKRFKKLDTDKSGSLSLQELLDLPQIKKNPLAKRIVDVLDHDSNGEIDFQEFVEGLCKFSDYGDRESKLRFAFKIYDMDNDGFISNGELFQVLKAMVGGNLKDEQLQQIVDKTIRSLDDDHDGKISYDEFSKIVGRSKFDEKMTLTVPM
eukprot:TRINITY_DN16696_c0_g1_i1.p1 TRINITY_DN16696_c0_g1~~TRINITY_DN16696_c0_g1_i1.p1  ORF type:complete len:173 (-),score=41.90 TRINITY_DN16696_c0_g1_i1:39-557(-)